MDNSQYVIGMPHQLTQQDSSQEITAEVLMAIDSCHDSVIGCALFNVSDETLHVAEDVPRFDLDLLNHFSTFAQSILVLLSSRAPRQLLEYVERCITSDRQRMQVVASVDFSATSAREKLSTWAIDPASDSCQINIDLWLKNNQNMVSRDSLRASQKVAFHQHGADSPETLKSLQVFPAELHSKGQSWGMKGVSQYEMQSISLYNLLHSLTHTPQGRARLRAFLRSPLSNLGIIESRQRAISQLLDRQKSGALQEIIKTLKKIRNAKTCVELLRKGVDRSSLIHHFGDSVWSNLRGFVCHALKLRDLVYTFTNNPVDFLHDAASRIHRPSLTSIGEILHRTVDLDHAEYDTRPTIMIGVDPELDKMRRDYDGLSILLEKIALSIVHDVPRWAARLIKACTFLPQVGFLIAVERNKDVETSPFPPSHNGDDVWEEFFVADGAVHYKNNRMRHLDEQFGDIYRDIADREVEVLHRLATQVLQYDEALLEASDACGDVDAILTLALAADKYEWAAPRMTIQNVIHIENGRHPLQELTVPSFIPNHCNLYGEPEWNNSQSSGRCMIVTGPNSSGKSIYLKQVALIVYLAHIGSYVPAEMAVIGITDRILARITTPEGTDGQDSAFATDLKQLHYAITNMTSRSLLIIDEFAYFRLKAFTYHTWM
ncbi:hypothetical protein E4U17_007376 [Claviceps sp. LM77 group G4]|nr:hypothetical protein E4U17_007376 [Claviceps sp. LM77 group G4]